MKFINNPFNRSNLIKSVLVIFFIGGLFAIFISNSMATAVSSSNSHLYLPIVNLPGISVTNTNDSGPGSLRQAILDANAQPGHATINFNIPGTGKHVIALQSVLPPLTDPATVNGRSQVGYITGSPVIEINGAPMNLDFPMCKGPANGRYRDNAGIDVRLDPDLHDASGSKIIGLKISDFCQGISVSGEVAPRDNNTAFGCQNDGEKINNITIENNVLVGNNQGNAALDLCNATDSRVQGNFLDNQSDNIELAHSQYVTVSDNSIHNGKDGVSLVNAHYITIHNNEFNATSTGIHMKFDAADNIVSSNVMTNIKRFGIALSDNNLAIDNVITGSGWFGIEIRGGSNNSVTGNTLTHNGFSRDEPIFAGIVVGAGSRRALGVNCNVNELGEPSDCEQDAEWNPWRQASSFNNIIHNNEIAYNNGPGILIGGTFNEWVPDSDASTWDPETKAFIGETLYYADHNSLLNNAIYGNVGMGIDLSDTSQFLYHDLPEPFTAYFVEIQNGAPDGATPNDSGLVANNGQNRPQLHSATAPADQSTIVVVQGSLDAQPNSSYRISLYANSEPTGLAGASETVLSWQGEIPLRSRLVHTNQDGHVDFRVSVAKSRLPTCTLTLSGPETAAGCITSSATLQPDAQNNVGSTSEFSNMVTVTSE